MADVEPTDRELEALKVLWKRGESTVRQVYADLNTTGEPLAYTTVLSLFQVMEQKGLVAHRQEGKAYIYRPLVEQRKTFRQIASKFLDRVFDGAIDEYLVHAIEGKRLTSAELDQLEAMIAKARASKRRK
jgi:BlaI family penicillinase repressor